MTRAPQYRQDPTSGRWVIIAPERSDRPEAFNAASAAEATATVPCPFCPGNEGETPHELFALRTSGQADEPGWSVRVVPNRFPSVSPAPTASAYGRHEVIIECAEHWDSIGQASDAQWQALVNVYRDRLLAALDDPRIEHAFLFKNQGRPAGASQSHPHAQLMATDRPAPALELEYGRAATYHRQAHRCLWCDLIDQELANPVRLVAADEHLIAWCPSASRFPFEICLAPRVHQPHFEQETDATLAHFAVSLARMVRLYDSKWGATALNYCLHSAPLRASAAFDFHWHWELTPRIVGIAGFELGAGMHINPVAPEDAAAQLRETLRRI